MADEFAKAGENFAQAMRQISYNLKAQTTLGHLLRGNLAGAERELTTLPVDQVERLSLAASGLVVLADAEVERRA